MKYSDNPALEGLISSIWEPWFWKEWNDFEKLLDELQNSKDLFELSQEEMELFYKYSNLKYKIDEIAKKFKKEDKKYIDDIFREIMSFIESKNIDRNENWNQLITDLLNEYYTNNLTNFNTISNWLLDKQADIEEYLRLKIMQELFLDSYELDDSDKEFILMYYIPKEEFSEEQLENIEKWKDILHNLGKYNSLDLMWLSKFKKYFWKYHLPKNFWTLNEEYWTEKVITALALFLARKKPEKMKEILEKYFSSYQVVDYGIKSFFKKLYDTEWNKKNNPILVKKLKHIIWRYVVLKVKEYINQGKTNKKNIVEMIKEDIFEVLEKTPFVSEEEFNNFYPPSLENFTWKKIDENNEKITKENNKILNSISEWAYNNRVGSYLKDMKEKEWFYDDTLFGSAEKKFKENKEIFEDLFKFEDIQDNEKFIPFEKFSIKIFLEDNNVQKILNWEMEDSEITEKYRNFLKKEVIRNLKKIIMYEEYYESISLPDLKFLTEKLGLNIDFNKIEETVKLNIMFKLKISEEYFDNFNKKYKKSLENNKKILFEKKVDEELYSYLRELYYTNYIQSV